MNKLPFLSADSAAAPPPQPPSWVLITGGAARLGKALCLAFADAGWNVVLHYRHSHAAAQQVQALVQAKGQQCTLLQADLAQPHAAQQLLADCAMALGGQPLRCVVNNASQFEPDTAATASESPTPALRTVPAPLVGSEGRQRHILVVDDETAVRDLIRQTLLRHDYRISEAANGAEALVLLAQRENSVDLVIADLLMPVLDGASLIQELHRRRPHLPIVAMSGNIARDQISPETKAAIHVLLPKPSDAAQHLAALDAPAG